MKCDSLEDRLPEHYRRCNPCGDFVRRQADPDETRRQLVAHATENKKTFVGFQHLRMSQVRESLQLHHEQIPNDLNELDIAYVLEHIWTWMMHGSFENDDAEHEVSFFSQAGTFVSVR